VAGSSSLIGPVLAGETPTEPKHAVLELASFLNAEVSVTEIILEARIVGLKKVVRLCWLLVVAGWVRGCARLMLVLVSNVVTGELHSATWRGESITKEEAREHHTERGCPRCGTKLGERPVIKVRGLRVHP
jgi:hypothetical protein